MDFEHGLEQLRACLAQRAPDRLADFHTLEARLAENENDELIVGSSENTRQERNQILRALNKLALTCCDTNFNELCEGQPSQSQSRQHSGGEGRQAHLDEASQYPKSPPKNPFLDVLIRIREQQESGYPVYVELDHERESERGFLDADVLPWVASGDPAKDGQRLFNGLLPPGSAPRTMWERAVVESQQRRVRLRIDTEAPELHALPWELLHDGESFLAATSTTPFSRYLTLGKRWGRSVEKPLRVLAVISNPNDLSKYNLASLDEEQERCLLKETVGHLSSEKVQLDFLEPPVTLKRLERELRTAHNGEGYHVLHFVGHGTFSQRREQAALFMQDAEGHAQVVKDDEFIAMLKRLQPQALNLIYLAACQSAERAKTDAFAGLAPQLVRAGVPAVVAMQDKVAMTTARQMTTDFYGELLRHGAVDRALNAARSTLLIAKHPDAAVPALFMRLKDGRLFELHTEELGEEQTPSRPFWLSLAIVMGVVIAMVAGLFAYRKLRPPPALIGSEFNVAIAAFSAEPEGQRRSQEGTAMAYYIQDSLRRTLSEIGYAPEDVDIRVYDPLGARHDRAANILDRVTRSLDEDTEALLVYGYHTTPEAYHVYYRFHRVREAAELGDALLAPTQALSPTDQTSIVISFTLGLVELYAGDNADAELYFSQSVGAAESLHLDTALDTLYFFLGRTQAALGDSVAARSAYSQALTYNPDYGMSYIGLGNLYYADVVEDYVNGQPLDCEDLDPAVAAYEKAVESRAQPYTAWVDGKAYVMMGNVYSWCGQATGDITQLHAALDAYDAALAAYEEDRARTEYRAMVYYVRGVVYERLGYRAELADKRTEAMDWYAQAQDAYMQCKENAGMRQTLVTECANRLYEAQKVGERVHQEMLRGEQ